MMQIVIEARLSVSLVSNTLDAICVVVDADRQCCDQRESHGC